MTGCQRDDRSQLENKNRAGTDEQRTSSALHERCKGCLDVAVAADIENVELLPDRLSGRLHLASLPLGVRKVRVHEHGDCRRLGHQLTQQLQPLRP